MLLLGIDGGPARALRDDSAEHRWNLERFGGRNPGGMFRARSRRFVRLDGGGTMRRRYRLEPCQFGKPEIKCAQAAEDCIYTWVQCPACLAASSSRSATAVSSPSGGQGLIEFGGFGTGERWARSTNGRKTLVHAVDRLSRK
ncbi:hypothetical protein SAMN05443249_1440 [Beijerinckia sp. 28-YEA-48]|nr:hypothetical protein SAMN05443249_1440 [Beijerinckia sp. 28-YEA-48]